MGSSIDIDEVHAARDRQVERRLEITSEISRLREEAGQIDAVILDFDITIRVLSGLQNKGEPSGRAIEADESEGLPGMPGPGVFRRLIEATLNTLGRDGITVTAMRDFIKSRYGTDIQPNTISVTMSRLKGRGLARLEGQEWFPALPVEVWDNPAPSLEKKPGVTDDSMEAQAFDL
jgi:hypothetical protein